jgi:hypothetical protein
MNSYPDQITNAEALTAGSLVHRASDVRNVVAEQLAAAVKAAAGYVRSSPWQAAGALAVAGIAAGILVARGARRSRRRNAPADAHNSSPEVAGG